MKTPGRQTWKYKEVAKKYHEKHEYKPYTMIWNSALEAEMFDGSLSKEVRVLAAIRRYSWGNLSDWAVDAMPKIEDLDQRPQPMTQQKIGEVLGLVPSLMSHACIFLRDQGYLKKDHIYLYPEVNLTPLDSTKQSWSQIRTPDNIHSPYVRFRQAVLSKNEVIGKTVSEIEHNRNLFQGMAREATIKLRKIDRCILGFFRDFEREEKENSTESHTLESDSNSKMERFLTPALEKLEFELDSIKKANKNGNDDNGSLKSLKLEREKPVSQASIVDFSQSVGRDLPTDSQTRLREIENAITESGLIAKFHAPPTTALLNLIERKLSDAPVQYLQERIKARYASITSLGFISHLADDVGKAWRKTERARKREEAAKPTQAPDRWEGDGSWNADRNHWSELAPEQQAFYRQMHSEDCPGESPSDQTL